MKKSELREMIREELLTEGNTKIKGDVRGSVKRLDGMGIKSIEVDKDGHYIEIYFENGVRLGFDITTNIETVRGKPEASSDISGFIQ